MRIVAILLFFFAFKLTALWHEPKYKFYGKEPLRLQHLPKDILNHITSFLKITKYAETREEYRQRLKKVRPHYHAGCINNFTFSTGGWDRPSIFVRTPENKYKTIWKVPWKDWLRCGFFDPDDIGLIDQFAVASDLSALAVVMKKNSCFDHPKRIIYIHNLLNQTNHKIYFDKAIECIAVSSGGKKIAYMKYFQKKKGIFIYDIETSTNSLIEFKHLRDKRIRKSCINGIDFNKQGTQIGFNTYDNGIVYKSLGEHEIKLPKNETANDLELYFKQKGICKKFPQ